MLEFAEITLKDKKLFDECLKKYDPRISELTFTNLFMWRNFYKLRFSYENGFLSIVSKPDLGDPFAFIPIGDEKSLQFAESVTCLKEYFNKKGWAMKFKRVTEAELEYLKPLVSDPDSIILDRSSSDYVYSAEALIHLKGKKFDGKRNHINKFKKLYEYEYVPMHEGHVDEGMRIIEAWCAERSCDEHKDFYCEKLANAELLKNLDTLGCKGALISVNGRFEGFTIGEMLNGNTAVVHIEKANSSINGLYTFINQQFCEHEWSGAEYINREQDLGIEGLRKAKLSYHPVEILHKYTVEIV